MPHSRLELVFGVTGVGACLKWSLLVQVSRSSGNLIPVGASVAQTQWRVCGKGEEMGSSRYQDKLIRSSGQQQPMGYGQQPMGYGAQQQQPYVVHQQSGGMGAGAAGGAGCCGMSPLMSQRHPPAASVVLEGSCARAAEGRGETARGQGSGGGDQAKGRTKGLRCTGGRSAQGNVLTS